MTRDHTLEIDHLSLGYGERTVVDDVSTIIPPGRITAIIGANASGKSTLLRGVARLLQPRMGAVLLDGSPITDLSPNAAARVIGLLPQSPSAPDGITVGDLVGRGRYPHQGWFRRWSADDERAVDRALAATGTSDLVGRRLAELSGGQRQRAWIAMALAQETDVLLLDEPTTFLDLNHQVEVLDLLVDLNHEHGTTIVMVLHELNLACRYADHLIAMQRGRVAVEGRPADVVDAAMIEEVFELPCEVVVDPRSGTPLVVPLGRHRVSS
ncbi:ABC transporter ATP-binding protein [Agromyces albus]|uniref:ABC transporter ATP-binding protein n=1 Tax=Agromyces albus TaxID=205332 RepID=A0A4Q2L059_9MICO|nr:ABC transporter ATP-binding protein [Agromyces albus]RXZ70250.1 ABC transporter ATP-binding protein [Agromyces albus]